MMIGSRNYIGNNLKKKKRTKIGAKKKKGQKGNLSKISRLETPNGFLSLKHQQFYSQYSHLFYNTFIFSFILDNT